MPSLQPAIMEEGKGEIPVCFWPFLDTLGPSAILMRGAGRILLDRNSFAEQLPISLEKVKFSLQNLSSGNGLLGIAAWVVFQRSTSRLSTQRVALTFEARSIDRLFTAFST